MVASAGSGYTSRVSDAEAVRPQILVPYPGPQGDGSIQDIFVYLRPETNGVLVESVLLNVIKSCSLKSGIKLVYLANFPGEFIVSHHIVERHYSHKFFFAVHGGRAFTSRMQREFERQFGLPAAEARIMGSFEALTEFGMTPEELFSYWVDASDVLFVEGQTIKRINDVYIVNYDIPALLHKNNRGTDIAVMMFRCSVDYEYFADLVDEMRNALVEKGILSQNLPASKAFHFSKGPFEQLLDATDYLRTADGSPVDLTQLSFVAYALDQGYREEDLLGILKAPICSFEQSDGAVEEENIFAYTRNDTFDEALAKLRRVRSQLWIR